MNNLCDLLVKKKITWLTVTSILGWAMSSSFKKTASVALRNDYTHFESNLDLSFRGNNSANLSPWRNGATGNYIRHFLPYCFVWGIVYKIYSGSHKG
jgi:hypothetical protein